MGRVAGVTATETRGRLLRAAADAFARQGYDGTRVADIATSAGVSNGALYAHFGSKAELLLGALREHGRQHLADLFAADPGRPVGEMLLAIGRRLRHRPDAGKYLLVEALVAARRDEDVARPMRDYMGERADWLAQLIRTAQARGELDPVVSADALAHFCLLLTMGSALVTPESHAVDENEWAQLLTRLMAALAPPESRMQTTEAKEEGTTVKVQIDSGRCSGHGRCYDLAPDLFGADDEGYGQVLGNGIVAPVQEHEARLAAANCPEFAVTALEET